MSARKPLYPKLEEQDRARKQSYSEEEPEISFSEDSEYDDTENNVSKQSSRAGGSPSRTLPQYGPENYSLPKNQGEQSSGGFNWLIAVIILVIVAVSVNFLFLQSKPAFRSCRFDELRKRQPSQSDYVWKALQVGIENMLNKTQVTPNVYLFLYQDQSLGKLTQDIAQETSRCFGNPKFIEMRRDDFITNNGDDYGYAIEQYKKKIKDGKVLVIINLNELPAKVARALHTICDTVNPIAKDVVIFLTLQPLKQFDPNTKSIQLAVDTLYELWKKHLSSNELDPLITRVTDQVLYLQS